MDFVRDNNLVEADKLVEESIDKPIGLFSFQHNTLGDVRESIEELVNKVGVPEENINQAIESVAHCIANLSNNKFQGIMFNKIQDSISGDDIVRRDITDFYNQATINAVDNTKIATEAFGKEIDNTVMDARVVVTLKLLAYKRNILQRFIPNVPTTKSYVIYQITEPELNDLTVLKDSDPLKRYNESRTSFLDLNNDPSPADTEAPPLDLYTANDPGGDYLLADNLAFFDKAYNMFKLGVKAGTVGATTDFTDLVADGLRLKTVVIGLTRDNGDGTTTVENIPLDVKDMRNTSFIMTENTARDSADRNCNFEGTFVLGNDTTLLDGTDSVILNGLDDNHKIELKVKASFKTNLRTSETYGTGFATGSLYTVDGTTVLPAMETVFNALSFGLKAHEIEKYWSNENLKRTKNVVTVHTRKMAYTIPTNNSFAVVWSVFQTKPEAALGYLADVVARGMDARGFKLIMDFVTRVYDRIQAENSNPNVALEDRLNRQFPAGDRVKPWIYIDTFDIHADVENLESAALEANMRATMEHNLVAVTTRGMNESYYKNALPNGEKVVWNAVTSGYIIGLLRPKWLRNRMHQEEPDAFRSGGSAFDLQIRLPNDHIIRFVESTYDMFTDKILMAVNRPGKPRDVLNFYQNLDRGSLSAFIKPYESGGTYNQLITMQKEFPFPHNPVAALLTVSGISKVYNGLRNIGIV